MTMSGRAPIRVAVVDDTDLVTEGVARMLEPYQHRVSLVGLDDTGEPLDVVLRGHDVGMIALTATCRALVDFTWEARPGYRELSKALSAEALVQALEDIADPAVTWPVQAPTTEEWPGQEAGLSARESEIVALIANGFTNDQVAARAFLSINTVKSYIRSAYRKMGVSSRSRAVLWALDNGFGDRPVLRSVG